MIQSRYTSDDFDIKEALKMHTIYIRMANFDMNDSAFKILKDEFHYKVHLFNKKYYNIEHPVISSRLFDRIIGAYRAKHKNVTSFYNENNINYCGISCGERAHIDLYNNGALSSDELEKIIKDNMLRISTIICDNEYDIYDFIYANGYMNIACIPEKPIYKSVSNDVSYIFRIDYLTMVKHVVRDKETKNKMRSMFEYAGVEYIEKAEHGAHVNIDRETSVTEVNDHLLNHLFRIKTTNNNINYFM